MDAVSRQDVAGVILCLAHSKSDDVNCCVSQLDKRTSLHIAASLSNLVILQLLIWVNIYLSYFFITFIMISYQEKKSFLTNFNHQKQF